jgi:tRNA-uridine 2-sulfurtransferase
MKKCVVLFSGGLDSRLAVKIMQEQKFSVVALWFKLPFGCSNEKEVLEFSKKHKLNLKIVDCTKGKILQEYLEILRKPCHGVGKGVNPCVDCKIFMFKKAKAFADKNKIETIVTGEVLGERPMSQMKKSLDVIEKYSKLSGRLLRPLSAKLLKETKTEGGELVDRKKLYEIQGRQRKVQIELAKKFKIDYPTPAGGCLLCDAGLKNKFSKLFERKLSDEEIKIIGIGRHFMINNFWIVLGRDEKENSILENLKTGELVEPDFPGPSARIFGKADDKTRKIVVEMIKVYSGKDLEKRKKFDKWRL